MSVDPDIRRARTLPAEIYHRAEVLEELRRKVFPRAWHFAGDGSGLEATRALKPVVLAPGALDEPLLLARDAAGTVRALSNVCTHRGNILVESACSAPAIRCRYHGRRFDLTGKFSSMPEFEGVIDFPSEQDDLPRVPLASWGPLWFASLAPELPFERWIAPVIARTSFLPLEKLELDPASVREYSIAASWALYCDNYLEGLHIPFVHSSLARGLDYDAYRTELFERANLQIGVASGEEPCFELPAGHPDSGTRVAAWWFWLFPATMLNVYPWGVSLNTVEPHGPAETRVRFASYVFDRSAPRAGAGAELDRVEQEDEAVVLGVQRGIRSRLYRGGRYSPSREACVHHFHRLLLDQLGRGE